MQYINVEFQVLQKSQYREAKFRNLGLLLLVIIRCTLQDIMALANITDQISSIKNKYKTEVCSVVNLYLYFVFNGTYVRTSAILLPI